MDRIVEFNLSDKIKRQLGFIIRETRKLKLNQYKGDHLIENNPYTKENFCSDYNICHYHTLTRLEDDMVKEDFLYHYFLQKLNLYFQVDEEQHLNNLTVIHEYTSELLKAIEYLDLNLAQSVIEKVKGYNQDNDCISSVHLKLLKICYRLFFENRYDEIDIQSILSMLDFYHGVYNALANHVIGYYHYLNHNVDMAEHFYLKAKYLYTHLGISKGLSIMPLIDIHIYKNNYLEMIKLCNELEKFYLDTGNKNRLFRIYSFLTDYYLLIHSTELAKDYYIKTIDIYNEVKIKELDIYNLHFNWGISRLKAYDYEEALKYFELAYQFCFNKNNMLTVINRLLISYTVLKHESLINEFLVKGQDVFDQSIEIEQIIFRYFKYKHESPNYFRKFAIEKLLPILKEQHALKYLLLFVYEDLYNKNQ